VLLSQSKTYLRSSIQQEHLISLAMMAIKSEIRRGLNMDKILRTLLMLKHKNKFVLANAFSVS